MRTTARSLTDIQLRAAARLHGLASRVREDERGQASAEYAGIIFVVVAVVGAVAGFGDEIGQAIRDKIVEAVQAIKGAD